MNVYVCAGRNLKKTPQDFPNVKIDDAIKALADLGALKCVKDKLTAKIFPLNKEEGAKRFYAIRLNMLEE